MARQATAAVRPKGDPDPRGRSKFLIFEKFDKMNTKVARQNLPANEVAWMENLQPIAPNLLKSVPAAASALTTVVGKTAARIFPANVLGTDYLMFFATDGSLTAINTGTGAQTAVAPAATFSVFPQMDVFASQRILIMDNTGFYSTWDGTLFVGGAGSANLGQKGAISPNIHITSGGSGYAAPPTVSFTGGAGGNAGGATATAVLSGGSVVAVNVTNAGSGNNSGDAITVVFTGANTTPATATVVVWPPVKGSGIAVAFGRVWWGDGSRTLNFTGTGATTGVTWDDIKTADAAGSTVISDSDLAHQITSLKFLNNYLYIFGDQSVKQIGSITVSSSVTLFTILTLASDIGTSFVQSIFSYNRLVLFANVQGVYGIFGATVQKISDDLDGIFQNSTFTTKPSAGLIDLNNIHCYALLIPLYNDIRLGIIRSIIVVFQQNKWFVLAQGNSMLAMTSIPLATTLQFELFASSGADVTELVQNSNANVQILLITSLNPHGNLVQAKQVLRSGVAMTTAVAQSIAMTVDTENGANTYTFAAATTIIWTNNVGTIVQWQNNSLVNVNFVTGGFKMPDQDTEGYGKFIGNTISGPVMGLAINAIANEYIDDDMWGKNP